MSSAYLKELILGLLATTSSIVVFWFWEKSVPQIIAGEFQNYTNLIIPVVGLIISAALFSLAAMFIKNGWILSLSAIVSVVSPFFFVSATKVVVGAALISALLIDFAARRTRKEFTLSLGFSLSKILKSGLPLYFTVVSLIISTFYFSQLDEAKAISALLPKSLLPVALKSISGPLQSLTGLPSINPEGTADDLLRELALGELKKQGVSISQISSQELNRLISSQKGEFSKQLGIKFNSKEKVTDIFYNLVVARLSDFLGPYKKYLPLVSTLTFFLAFKTITYPLYYLTLLITFLLIKFLLLVKILRSEKEQIEVEKLTL